MKLIRYKKAVNIAWYTLALALIVLTFINKANGVCYLTFLDRLKNDPWLVAVLAVFALFAAVTVLSMVIDGAEKKKKAEEAGKQS